MDTATIEQYLALATAAEQLAGPLLSAIVHAFAKHNLSPEEYADLQAKWDADVARTAKNAGIDT